ncbi:hypothetical protein ABZU25_10230 [Micromonospora sp. NPDC005215]|uniref:hypothetical protein n=1 Tax=Micromonospora sp. NPDC005215 TaxID=3157024 RepID=UPI0033A24D4B
MVAASADGPEQGVGVAASGFDDQDVEQVAWLVDGQRDQPGRVGLIAVGGGEEGVGEDRQDGPAVR